MSPLLVTLHVIVAILLIGGILLQPGAKGGGLGSAFGGGGANSAFGARGAAPFLAKLTYWLAAGFMLTSLAIELKIVRENRSVLEKQNIQVKTAPAALPHPVTAPTEGQGAPVQQPAAITEKAPETSDKPAKPAAKAPAQPAVAPAQDSAATEKKK